VGGLFWVRDYLPVGRVVVVDMIGYEAVYVLDVGEKEEMAVWSARGAVVPCMIRRGVTDSARSEIYGTRRYECECGRCLN
jgi:hypothetical protein